MSETQKVIARSFARLSSGQRYAQPSDNSAAYFTSQRLQTINRGLVQANQNISMAQSLLQTTQSALQSQSEILQKMRELSVRGSSDLLSVEDRKALQLEMQSLLGEFNRITQSTEFNGQNVLASDQTFNFMSSSTSQTTEIQWQGTQSSETLKKEVASGSFSSTTYSIGVGGSNLRTADFNNDGIEDVAMSTSTGIRVQLGKGDGTFSSTKTLSGVNGAQFEVADLNGDNVMDLVSSVSGQAYGTVYLGAGDGTFTAGSTMSLINAIFRRFKFADLNGDGHLDLYGTYRTGTSGGFLSYLNDGQGNFSLQGTRTVFTPGGFSSALPSDLNHGDFNGDGIVDVVVGYTAGIDGTATYTLLGNGDGSFSSPSLLTSAGDESPTNILVDDLNGDSLDDIIMGVSSQFSFPSTSRILIFLSAGGGTFSQHQLNSLEENSGLANLQLVDTTGDGTNELVYSSGGQLLAARLNSNGTFDFNNATVLLHSINTNHPHVFLRLNDDSAYDIASVNSTAQSLTAHLSNTKLVSDMQALNLGSTALAQTAIEILDRAIQEISSRQTSISIAETGLEFRVTQNLKYFESIESARSAIQDADFAEESSNLVAAQILQQAQIAALAQANTSQQVTLQLLSSIKI